MILLIDNYDSFTYNLFQLLSVLGATVVVRRNDEISLQDVPALDPAAIVISPGPGSPDSAGISCEIMREFAGRIPIFGVCLGLQCLGEVFGGQIVRAEEVRHGKTSAVHHSQLGIFASLPSPFEAVRYHSLVVDRPSLPPCLEVTAETDDGIIMALRHRELDVEGVQFHPESVLTTEGPSLLRTFLQRCGEIE